MVRTRRSPPGRRATSAGPTSPIRATTRIVAALVVATLLTACASTPPTAVRPVRQPSTTMGPATSTTGAPTGSTPTTGGADTVACATSELAASVATGVAGGDGRTTVVLDNTSATACVLAGYPSLTLVDARGRELRTDTVDGGSFPFTALPESVVTLPPGGAASFNIGYSGTPTEGRSCTTGAALRITPPSNFDRLTVHVALTACPDGTLEVSPVLAGPDGASAAG